MKKTMKKLVAVLISICLLISTVAVFGNGVDTGKHTGSPIPVIYVEGTGMPIVQYNEDGSKTTIFPVELSSELITPQISIIIS